MSYKAELVIFVFGILFPGIKSGQTVLKKPDIHSLHIYSDIKYRFATTTVTSRIKNVDTKSREAVFDVTLPNEAFITNLTLEIDGKIILGEIKEKEVAKKQYEAAKQRGESAGYIGTKHRETNKFNLAVTVAPQDKVSFKLTYQELLKRTHGHYEQVIYIDPGQPVQDMDVTVSILESREITDLRVPPLRNDVMADIEDVSTITVITTPTPKTAHVKFVPSIEFQTAQSASGMAGQFRVLYDVEREMDIGDVLVVNGYFVHFFAPEGFRPIPNDVLFILDTSGSMTGKKLNQLKSAMQSILLQMNEGDRMNIMTFSGSTSFWKTEMAHITDEDTMMEAKAHISSLKAGGWTNINLALTTGITFLRDRTHDDGAVRSPVVVFLTDGEATSGVTDPEEILKNIKKVNEANIPVFSLAFGEYADYDIVKKISIQNNGLGRKIYEASDAAIQIAEFYNEIAVTLLNNITFEYLDAPVVNVTKHEYANYFNGSEMVISGKLETLDDLGIGNVLRMKIIGNSVDGTDLVIAGDLSNNLVDLSFTDNETNTGDFETITEKVWAYLTIKQLLNKELATSDMEEKKAYNKQVVELSLKYGFVTPLTSMVVTLPDEDDDGEETLINAEEKPEQQQQQQYLTRSHALQVPVMKKLSARHPASFSQSLPQPAYRPRSPSALGFNLGPVPQVGQVYHDILDRDIATSNSKQSVSRMGGGRAKHMRKANKKRKQRKRKNRRKNKKNSGFQYPLSVQFPNLPDPVCFNMYDDRLENSPGRYILYNDSDADLRVEVELEGTKIGKWTNQGGIKEIRLSSGHHLDVLTKETFESKSVSPDGDAPWELEYSPATSGEPATEIKVNFDAFSILLQMNGDDYINVTAERSIQHGALAKNGIIGQIMSKNFKVLNMKKARQIKKKKNRRTKKGKDKEMALLEVDGSRFLVMKRELGPPGIGTKKCWALKKKEDQMLDMTSARVI